MRLLLDEMLPRRLAWRFAPEMEAITVRQRGWEKKSNGDLISSAQNEFGAFVTMDRGILHQQNLDSLTFVILLLEARSNRLEDLAPLVSEAKSVLAGARPGKVIRLRAP